MRCEALGLICLSATLSIAAGAFAGPPTPYSKPGLWVLQQQITKSKSTFETKLCIDKTTQQYLLSSGQSMEKSMCSRNDTSVSGATVRTDSVCKIGGSTLTSHSEITYAGDSAFHGVTTGHFSPAFMGTTETRSTQDGKWSGACPAGMKPGDMYGPHGMKLHMGPNGPQPLH